MAKCPCFQAFVASSIMPVHHEDYELQALRLANPAGPGSIFRVLGREMASRRKQAERNVHTKQKVQHQAHVLAHVPDVVPGYVAYGMCSVGLMRRDCHERKPGDRPAKRNTPRNPSKSS